MPFAEQAVRTLLEPQPALLDFNHDPRYPGEHFTCCPRLVLEHHRRGNRPGKVKVTTLLQVTGLLKGRVRIQRKPPKVTIQALSHKGYLPHRAPLGAQRGRSQGSQHNS